MSPDIPDEILLQIIALLPMAGLVKAMGVCKKWRDIILDDQPTNPVQPVRKRLLDTYLYVISQSCFLGNREMNAAGLIPGSFDRQAYLSRVREELRIWKKSELNIDDPYPHIPEQYSIYILEWPERAIVDRLWPGLGPSDEYWGTRFLISSEKPTIYSASVSLPPNYVPHLNPDGTTVILPVLYIRYYGMGHGCYLLLDSCDLNRSDLQPLEAGLVENSDSSVFIPRKRSEDARPPDAGWFSTIRRRSEPGRGWLDVYRKMNATRKTNQAKEPEVKKSAWSLITKPFSLARKFLRSW